ncbi:Cbb3-type cytochrome c oxidase subunit CcoP2 [BD1-7 clade bacterium]|uniref:Cbb3-type cytochrome c oxidase subunit n=1 Tax=BD1-7 clade bacterium TaxID=2029982 RepID=A0A5S9QRW8_9GAMM|nr:Cbb3-type cytochrome c oxidase subunit CcoP2 [BD1-7 clade bacterium]CAA0121891.1 Cbb3-type cytochrome c oxidase subunit CcoP2 [BD1-7 clade bacterium]
MNSFWSVWVIVLTLGTIAGVTWLLFANRHKEDTEDNQLTSHVYDGVEEYDNPLPAWWFNLFLGTIIFAGIYLCLYPGLGNFKGLLGWSSTGQWQERVDKADAKFEEEVKAFKDVPAAQLSQDYKAVRMGERLYKSYCSSCHGPNAQGGYAFPNLTDDHWIWGGTAADITTTLTNGRQANMPPMVALLGNDLDPMIDLVQQIAQVKDISKLKDEPMYTKFQQVCAACHGPEAKGNPLLGSANLTSGVWLYGGTKEDIKLTLTQGRNGQMPAFKDILSPERIHLLVAFLLSFQEQQPASN